MRVVLVTSLERGGPVEHAITLARHLARLGARVEAVCATDGLAGRFEAAGAKVAVLPLRRTLDPATARRITRFAAGTDVVHAQDRRSGLWVRLGPRPREGALRVYTAHGLPEPYLPTPAGPRRPGLRGRLAYRQVDARLCRRADAVIVPSEAAAQLFSRLLGYPRARLFVVPHGVEVPTQVQRNGRAVGTIAHFEPVKGLDVFLRAAAKVAATRPDAGFLMFGEGEGAAELRRLRDSLGLGDRVEMAGTVPADKALTRLGVFVLTSYMETSGLALLEAMATGVPVVASRVGGVPENAPPETAQLVEPGDVDGFAAAITRLLDDPALAQRQADAARKRVKSRFTAEASARATLALYQRLLGQARR